MKRVKFDEPQQIALSEILEGDLIRMEYVAYSNSLEDRKYYLLERTMEVKDVNTAGVGSVFRTGDNWSTTYFLKIAEDLWIESRSDGAEDIVYDADIRLWEKMESATVEWVEWISREDDGWGGFKTASGKDWKKEYCENQD